MNIKITVENMSKEIIILIGSICMGYLIGGLHQKWLYFKKTGKYLQDVKNKNQKQ